LLRPQAWATWSVITEASFGFACCIILVANISGNSFCCRRHLQEGINDDIVLLLDLKNDNLCTRYMHFVYDASKSGKTWLQNQSAFILTSSPMELFPSFAAIF